MTTDQSGKADSSPPWSVAVTLSEIPEGGKKFDLVADETTRAEIARTAGLRSLPRLQATFVVARQGAGGLRVDGEVSATVGQDCVVTLEPLENEIREDINLNFALSGKAHADSDDGDTPELLDPDGPELLVGNTIDLGILATEFLIMGIDPYPRKPGARFEPPAAGEDSTHPFAALAALKKGPEKKE